ncbi:hypothetical protein [Xanthobacter autotrophicus]|uniref:hypothetical protein n=1 Tax=Xanthobacter autotrophicus TaxID=280 RepID=UPI002B4BD0A8|nr:hypothetical protein [Xanthobacter autotrophicus]
MLRDFNVAGADSAGRCGQSSRCATHLIKVAAEAVASRRPHIDHYGKDYDTPDGTCIQAELGWKPRFDDLEVLVRSALDWEEALARRQLQPA